MVKLMQQKQFYKKLIKDIGITIHAAKENAIHQINSYLVKANWEIGRHIVEYEQLGEERAEYGSALLERLSVDLKTAVWKRIWQTKPFGYA